MTYAIYELHLAQHGIAPNGGMANIGLTQAAFEGTDFSVAGGGSQKECRYHHQLTDFPLQPPYKNLYQSRTVVNLDM
jgi:hypothetical protein